MPQRSGIGNEATDAVDFLIIPHPPRKRLGQQFVIEKDLLREVLGQLNKITEEDAAPAQGTATFARVLRRDGGEVFSCDVGDLKSDAVIKLSTTTIAAGSPVRLDSFVLSLP